MEIKRVSRRSSLAVLIFWICFFALCAYAVAGPDGLLDLIKKQGKVDRLRADVEALKAKNRELREEIRLIRTDPFFLEKVAREKLNLVKEGETVYRFKRTRPPDPAPNQKCP